MHAPAMSASTAIHDALPPIAVAISETALLDVADVSAVEFQIIGLTENKMPPGKIQAMMPLMAQRLSLKQAAACERTFEPEYRSALDAYDKVGVLAACLCLNLSQCLLSFLSTGDHTSFVHTGLADSFPVWPGRQQDEHI
jgi:hypothetical protein